MALREYQNVKVEREDGITFVILNRPEKRNAMSPALNADMLEVLTELEGDPDTRVLVLTGAGDAFSAGMDLREYFRAMDNAPEGERLQARWVSASWMYHKLRMFPKPTIAMVNGWCFGGAFTPLTSCDIAIAAEDAIFGLSEVNWGILPGGFVSRDVAAVMSYRDALFYILTGRTFTGKQAAEMKLVTYAVPRERLRDEVVAVARELMQKNPVTLKACKQAFKMCREMSWEQAYDYLAAKIDQMRLQDPEHGREQGMRQFLDEKLYKPGLGPYQRGR
ncbi:MAG TPA: p-hydroxycinnamoyl CoA hydratase/lyase [Chloroflexota bacterium]|jgi:trans-feruloyl-CoA hydratase/vanillin synthase|nr:p-hydroxycinnamoyl CoA hydratase/lyase [Chloroflexota bacterium]